MLISGALAANAQITTSLDRLVFAHQVNSTVTPSPQKFYVFTPTLGQVFTATAQTLSGGNWLQINGQTTFSGINGEASAALQIHANPNGVPAGDHDATITITATGQAPKVVNVRLVHNGSPQVYLNPGEIPFAAQSGTATTVRVFITTPGKPSMAVSIAVNSTTPWVTVTPATVTTGNVPPHSAFFDVTASAAALNAGVYFSTLEVRPEATPGASVVTLPISLAVTQSTTLVASPSAVNFGFQVGAGVPASRSVGITTSTGAASTITASVTSGSWLTLSPLQTSTPGSLALSGGTSGTTPFTFYLVANPTGLAAGTHNAVVSVSGTGIPGSIQIPVSLLVSNSPLILPNPEEIVFNYQLGAQAPVSQVLAINSSGQALDFAIAAPTVPWLTVAPLAGRTNSAVLVSINANQLGALTVGQHTTNISITAPGAGNTPVVVPVRLNISGSTLINVSPLSLTFNAQQGQGAPAAQSFTVTSTDGTNQTFRITAEPANSWILPSEQEASTGATGRTINVNVNPAALTQAGAHTGSITIQPVNAGGQPVGVAQRITVTLNLSASTLFTATPDRLAFRQTGATAPPAQTIQLGSSLPNQTFVANSNQPWLQVTPLSGTAPATLTITLRDTAAMAPGTYQGNISVLANAGGVNPLNIPVTLVVDAAATLSVAPATLTFTHTTGNTAPAAQTVNVSSTGAAVAFTATAATASGPGNWLSVTPASGTTNANGTPTALSVAVNPGTLPAGTYTGTVRVEGANATNSPQTVNVTLIVQTPAAPQGITVLSAATLAPTNVAPGMILTLMGSNLGPTTGVLTRIVNGSVERTVSDVRVTFDGVEAPLLFVRNNQINLVAPYSLFGRVTTRLVVEYRGVRSEPIELRVVDASPGIFSIDSSGRGQGAILNQDGTVNSSTNTAARGSIIVIYATGEGQTSPAGADGRVIGTDLRTPNQPVTVTIGGVRADVLYAGSAPGLVSGALQVNARVPNLSITAPGSIPVQIQVGNNPPSAAVITVAVRP